MQNALVFPRETNKEAATEIVEASPRLSGVEQLAIYQRSYYLRLLKCMDEQFPALRHALGNQLFTDFAREYLRALPSQTYTLYELGGRFPGYLDETRPDRDKPDAEREGWVNFMVDLARCERDLFVMFDAPGHEGKPFAVWAVPDERLRLQPCLSVRSYRFPVSWYYHEVRKGESPALPPVERTYVALVRNNYITRTYPLTPSHHLFLKSMADGKSVGEALELVAGDAHLTVGEVSAAWSSPDGVRKRWIDAGFFVDAEKFEPSQ